MPIKSTNWELTSECQNRPSRFSQGLPRLAAEGDPAEYGEMIEDFCILFSTFMIRDTHRILAASVLIVSAVEV